MRKDKIMNIEKKITMQKVSLDKAYDMHLAKAMCDREFYVYTDTGTLMHVMEGNGSNLWPEDEAEGYKDYAMLDWVNCTPEEAKKIITEEAGIGDIEGSDGVQSMLENYYQDFKSTEEAAKYFIDAWIGNSDNPFIICHDENDVEKISELDKDIDER